VTVVFANNTTGTVTSGGTTAPTAGTVESWTVGSITGFPTSLASGQTFHVADTAAGKQAEKNLVTAITGTGPYTWTVTRGDEGTTPVAHAANFTIQQVISAGDYTAFSQSVSVKTYGAKGDGQQVTDGAMGTIGSGVLTSATGLFASTDVGKYISVVGAGAAGAPLVTTIASFQSATQVTLTATASAIVTGKTVYWGTDDSVAIGTAITTAGVGGVVFFPPGATYLAHDLTPLNYQTWRGPGATIKWDGGANTSVIVSNSGTLTGWMLRDIAIDGGGAANATAFQGVVRIQAGTHCAVENVVFTNGPSGATMLSWSGGTRCTTHNCKFTNVGYAIVLGMGNTDSYPCTGNVISDCEIDTTVFDAIYVTTNLQGTAGALSGTVYNTAITGCVIRNHGDGGIEIGMGCVNTSVSNCSIYAPAGHAGLYIDGCTDTSVTGCALYGAGASQTCTGFNVFNNNSAFNPTQRVTIADCTIVNWTNGFYVDPRDLATGNTLGAAITDLTIADNTIYGYSASHDGIYMALINRFAVTGNTICYAGEQGIELGDWMTPTHACSNGTISGNTIMSNSFGSGVTYAGIQVQQGCADIVITGNRVGDDQATKSQAYGIQFSAASSNIVVSGNDLTGNATGPVSWNTWTPTASNNIIFDANLGYNPLIGYANGSGAGGTVTQATSKSTGVTLSNPAGQITMNAAALAAGTIVSFTLTNTFIAATDVLLLNHVSGGTPGSYSLNAQCGAGSATINVRNNTAGSLSEAIVIAFVVVKGATS
jgi:hypothetical protein